MAEREHICNLWVYKDTLVCPGCKGESLYVDNVPLTAALKCGVEAQSAAIVRRSIVEQGIVGQRNSQRVRVKGLKLKYCIELGDHEIEIDQREDYPARGLKDQR